MPDYLLGKVWKGKYRGQKQKWFVMRFLGNENEIKLNTKHAEFLEWKWIELEKITNKKYWIHVNEYFVRFGQLICKPINPRCYECRFQNTCRYLQNKGKKK